MILDFASIKHDFYGKVEQPVLVLKTPSGTVISTISNYFGLKCTFRFNDVSEVSFNVPAYYEDENGDLIENNGYDSIVGMKQVYIEPYGDFILVNPVKRNEGGKKEVKECKAYSLEYAFNYKKAEIPAGTYNFYNPADNADCITQMIIEFMPDWSIGTVDRELIGRWRTFDNVDDNLYSFMMNTLQESYNCLFIFDTFNKKINVMSANNSVSSVPIYLSYDNLLKSVDITELTDEMVTALSGYGSGDDVNIRSVNPNGSNTIYNLDYFIGNGDLSGGIAARWAEYCDVYSLYQEVFSNLNVLYIQKVNEKSLADAKASVLKTEYDAINTAYLTAATQAGQSPEYDEEIERLKEELEDKQLEIDDQKAHIETLEADVEEIDKQITEIVDTCKLSKFFSAEELSVLTQYFVQESIAEDTFVIPEYSSAILESNSSTLTPKSKGVVKVVGSEIYASNIAEIFQPNKDGTYSAYITDPETGELVLNPTNLEIFSGVELPNDVAETVADQLNQELKRKTYEFRGGSFEFSQTTTQIVNGEEKDVDILLKGDVVNVDFHYNADNTLTYEDENSPDITKEGYFTLTATLRNAKYNDVPYPNMNVSISGMVLDDEPFIGDDYLAFNIDTAVFYNTASVTEYQKQAVIQELYDYTKDMLAKLSTPSFEFSVDSANFIFAQEFEPFKDELKLGSTIFLAITDDGEEMIKPILIEVTLDYDDETNFLITFSSKYRSSDPEFKLADIITEASYTSHSVSLNKATYSSYKDSEAGNQVDKLTNNNLDVARNNIINSTNQGMEWNSSGMFLRKTLPNGTYDPEQVGFINNLIAMTDDNWDSVKLAIGHFTDKNIGDTWGIVAPNITGTLLAGNNLVIENTVYDETGLEVVKQFKVDGSGTWLNNSSFILQQEPNPTTGYPGGKILLDPRWGIAAGNINLFTIDGTTIIPSFWDEEEDKIIWDETKVVETSDGSVYYVPLNTQFYFDINTGNAYFSGTISGENIVAETINGNVIKDGTINAGDKLYGDIPSDQMYKEILNAINQYAEISQEGDKISLNLIGGLTNLNFEGGTITADAVDASNITGDLIEAINASIGKIDADKINVGEIDAGSITMTGTAGKLTIDPDWGIAAGSLDLFTTDDEGNVQPAFLDENGDIIIDPDTGAPLYSSFFFDIETGKTYFTGEINAAQITAGKISSDYLNVKEGYITSAMIESLSAGKIVGGSITADVMSSNVISAINAYLGDATINSAKISDLSADKITSGTLDADFVTVTGTIDGNNANIININAQNIDTDTITSDFSNSIVGQIGNATIKSAMIESITFDKITGFDINTTNLTIHSNDGKSTWSDNTIQISDANRVRVQIGEDADDDYNMYVWDADGNLMFDALGVTSSGIQRPIIKDDMVADNAAIQASKLDITSLFKTVNDNIEQIDAGSLKFDGKEFSVIFNTITTDLDAQEELLSSQGTALEVVQGQITSKVWQQDIDEAAGELETQFSTLQQDLNGFKVSVGQTYSEKSETTSNVQILYVLTDSGVTTPSADEPWSEIAPEWINGKYMWQKIIQTRADGTTEVSGPTCITGAKGEAGASGEAGEDAVILRIDSSRGTIFKNDSVNTVLSVVIYKGEQIITTLSALETSFGTGAHLEWSYMNAGEEGFTPIPESDKRLTDGNFKLTLSTEDVDDKIVFQCQLITE